VKVSLGLCGQGVSVECSGARGAAEPIALGGIVKQVTDCSGQTLGVSRLDQQAVLVGFHYFRDAATCETDDRQASIASS
jgi:hypothetical protein